MNVIGELMFVASVNPYVVGLITCIATMSLNLKLQKQILMEPQLRKKIDQELRAIMRDYRLNKIIY